MMNTFDKFSIAEYAENVFADVYRLLAEQFAGNPKYYALFVQLEQEEIQHAMRIRMLRKHYLTEGEAVKAIQLNMTPLLAFTERGEALKRRLETGEKLGTLPEIAAMLVSLELQFAGAHAEMILDVSDSNLRKFFEKLAEQDRGHSSLLRP